MNTIEVSGNLFDVLGVRPQVGAGFPIDGPLFVPNEAVAVISDRLWRTRYSADPSIIGRQLRFNDAPYTIVGVMPPKFHYPDDVDVWERLTWDMTQHSRRAHFMEAVARLSEGTTIAQAQGAVDALWTRLEQELGETRNSPGEGWGSRLIPLLDQQLGYYRPAMFVLFGAVGLLLTIGVLNVASLLLTRALSREREVAIRIAMGAAPRQLVTQLMAEGLVLSVAGAAIGIAAAAAALPLLVHYMPLDIPRIEEAGLSWPALALGLGVAAITTIVFGLIPALLLLRGHLATDLKAGERGSSRGARRTYSVLVAAEVALACALLAGSALLVRTVRQMMDTPMGVTADDVVVTTVKLTRNGSPGESVLDQWREIADSHARIMETIRRQPGVTASGGSNFLPIEIGWRGPFVLQGQPIPALIDEAPQAQLRSASDGYFETMGAEMVAGRTFTAFDGPEASGVVIVNETFARRFVTEGPAVGQVLRLFARGIGPLGANLISPTEPSAAGIPFEVVGVVTDVRNVPLGQTVEPAIYTSTRQFPFTDLFIAVRAADTATAISALRSALQSVAPDVPMGTAETWGDRFATRTAEPRLLMSVLLAFGVVAMLLAALGVYGLFSWSVALRTRELAIRLTLGARPAAVGGLVLRQSALLIAAGLVAGLALVRLGEGALTRVLYEVSPSDPGSLATASAVLLTAALVALVPPALRAMRVDPVEGMREE